MTPKAFYLVWCPTGGPPRVSHDTLQSARNEANRLAREYPGSEFVVLVSVGSAKKLDVEWKEHESDQEPPF